MTRRQGAVAEGPGHAAHHGAETVATAAQTGAGLGGSLGPRPATKVRREFGSRAMEMTGERRIPAPRSKSGKR